MEPRSGAGRTKTGLRVEDEVRECVGSREDKWGALERDLRVKGRKVARRQDVVCMLSLVLFEEGLEKGVGKGGQTVCVGPSEPVKPF